MRSLSRGRKREWGRERSLELELVYSAAGVQDRKATNNVTLEEGSFQETQWHVLYKIGQSASEDGRRSMVSGQVVELRPEEAISWKMVVRSLSNEDRLRGLMLLPVP